MASDNWISIQQISDRYEVEISFIHSLHDLGLIEVITYEELECVHKECLNDFEKLMRLHFELDINMPGIGVVAHLLNKIDHLQKEVQVLKNELNR